jgi:hypothetical protein
MPEYLFRGTVTSGNVTFRVEAANPTEAKDKARRGLWEDYDDSAAENLDCDLDLSTIELNE